MKTRLSIICILLVVSSVVWSQTKPIQIVFDVTSKDTLTQQIAMHHVTLMANAYPDAKLELVVYSGSLPMFVKGQSTVAKNIEKLAGNKNVSFKACGVTMKRYNIDKSQLIAGVEVVPDAILEIIDKQGKGWGYIKEAQ